MRRSRSFAGPSIRLAAGLLVLAAGTWAGAGTASGAPGGTPATSWTVYHASPAGTGVAPPVTSVNTANRAWTSPGLDGDIYGEPLIWAGRVYVATEDDTVYALSAATGAVAWSAHLATPVPAGALPCGDIQPTVGITGTPVIDPARGEIFVVADEFTRGRPAHVLFGLNAATGRTEMSRKVDPAGADPAALLQRTGLTLDAGQVVFAMGGNFGDCASYRGRVVAVPEAGGTPRMFTVDAAPGQSQGAIWMGGAAPVVNGADDVLVSVGNGSVHSPSQPYDNSDSLLELSPALQRVQFFAPGTWAQDNAQDLDMSMAPVLLPSGQVILAGKSRIVYLLDGAHLGGIGHQQATLPAACSEDIDGGIALSGMTVYLPCRTGLVAIRASASPPALRRLWTSGTAGGPPILAAGLVWTIGQDGVLYGLDPATGQVRQHASIGTVANHFPSPSVADGLMLAPAARTVVAFTASGPAAAPGTSGTPAAPAPAPGHTGHAAPPAAGGGLPAGAIAGIVAGGVVVIASIGWLLWRRRAIGHN
ncbi:MAG TPA: PQQ-binding-like beta-propeller repeat protein [Streptosporangiaceae bacterium]|nr:PQQ-binding-like beta-propeller repeat protein [Streptosporangiaceae bacterium]